MEIFKLFGSIFIDNNEADKSIAKTEEKASNLGETFRKIGKVALAAGALIGGAFFGIALKGVKDAAEAQEKVSQLEAVLKSTGGVAGVTKDEVLGLADAFEKTTKFSAESTLEGQNLLLTFTKIGKDVFPQATETMLNMATAMGGDASSQAIALGKALNDPIAGVASLTRVGVQFTDEQKNTIKAMMDVGNMAGAQKVILAELETQFGGSAIAAGQTFAGQLEIAKNSIGAVVENVGTLLLPIIQNFLDWVITNMPTIQTISQTAFDVISVAIDKVFTIFNNNILPILKVLFEWIKANMPQIKAIAIDAFERVWEIIKRLWDLLDASLIPVLKLLWDFVEPHFPKIGKIIKGAFDIVIGIVETTIGVFETLVGWITKAVEWLGKFKNANAGNNSGGTLGTGSMSASVSKYTNIPGLATGGTVTQAGRVLVGEQGPEFLDLPKGAKVTPLDKAGTQIVIGQGAFAGAVIMDDYGVDRLMDRVHERLQTLGVK